MNLILWLIVGGLAGWLAGEIMRGRGFGCIGNVLIGLVGGVIGGYVFGALKILPPGSGWISELVTALVGAIVLLGIANILSPRRR
jgi:uncharacterized membrane protein YeaQ/YmgE (transglycosylase-associated protein family)